MKGQIFGTLVILGVLSTLGLQPVYSEIAEISDGEIPYHRIGDRSIAGYLVKPQVAGKYPALILIHEWWGLNDDIREKAREFAKQGFVALAVDLYGGKNTTDPEKARELAGGIRENMEAAFANLQSAVEFLKNNPSVSGDRLASIGWCFGGGWSYEMAKNDLGIKASVIYYGRFNPEDDLKKMRADIIGHFAEKDMGIKVDDVNEFRAKLKTTKGEHEIYIYPNTTHGFASRPGSNPGFDEKAARLAWKRTLEFLEKHL